MTTEAKLVAKVETKGAKQSAKELDKFSDSAEGAEKSTLDFQKALKAGGAIAAKAVTGLGVAATAMTAIAIKSANASREWKTFANIANSSVSEFKAAAFAAESVGISAEKLADISKDTREKLGEFVSTGGGGFKDFFEQVAPLVNLTADELQNLSGPDVLLRVQKAMEDANVPLERQSFLLESIASDTTNLIPLLANEGAELNRLAESYSDLNTQLEVTAGGSQGLKDVSEGFNLLQQTGSNALTFLTSQFAPDLAKFLNFISAEIPQATRTIGAFFDRFRDAENRQAIDSIMVSLMENLEEIAELEENTSKRGTQIRRTRIAELREENQLLEERKKTLLSQERELAASNVVTAPSFSQGSDTNDLKLKATLDRETELMEHRKKLRMDFEIFEEESEQNYLDRLDARAAAESLANQVALKEASNIFGSLAALQSQFGDEQSSTYKALFAAQQAFNIASAISNIQAASVAAANDPTAVTLGQKLANYGGLLKALTPSITAIQNAGNFEQGGFVGGTSFSGDNVVANVNSGEAILNSGQQRNFMEMANGGGGGANVEVNNYAGDVATASASVNDEGKIVVIVNKVLQSEVNNPNSPFSKNMKRNYNLPRSFA